MSTVVAALFGRKAPVRGLPSLGVRVPLKLKGAQSERLLFSTRGSPNYTLKLRCSVANADDFNLNDQHVEEPSGGESKFVEAVSSHVDNNGTLAGSALEKEQEEKAPSNLNT
ncbi:hypothetical protein R1sor_014500 [Riccia sorocarpa]|uniref:Uncharacterized protein n=1 Tax=Riccia sorocarpa TaxID=122646 RepID=A0ABD3HBE6_9MARC